jgi:dTDP-4-amino-4,6-dideoxygalactose transaminase
MIKFLDLYKINARFEKEFKMAFQEFLDSGQYILGKQVLEFEKAYASYCGTKYCIGVSSGLDALQLIFEAYKILGILKEGDEVIVPANTYIATILAISHAKLKPILIEPDIETFNIDTSKLERIITKKTKAILGVHLYGQLYDVDELEKIAKTYNLLLIEDAAHAHGAKWKDERKAGNLSDAAAFSFYPTKNLGALGDGGAVTSNNPELVETIMKLRNYGRTTTYENDLKGYNCRLDELQASFLRIKLQYLDEDNEKRRKIAKYYLDNIQSKHILLPSCNDIERHVFHLFVIGCDKRKFLQEYLQKNGIETLIHYPIPVHKQLAYHEWKNYKFPITEKIHDEILSLPMHQMLNLDMAQQVVNAIKNF